MADLSPSGEAIITHDEVFKLLNPTFERAVAEGSLNFYESTTHIHTEGGVDVRATSLTGET
jgi:hypothetical protein